MGNIYQKKVLLWPVQLSSQDHLQCVGCLFVLIVGGIAHDGGLFAICHCDDDSAGAEGLVIGD